MPIDADSLGGPSYIMIPPHNIPDTVNGYADRIIHYNNQIRRWQHVLANNEESKVKVHHSSSKIDWNKWDEVRQKASTARFYRDRLRDTLSIDAETREELTKYIHDHDIDTSRVDAMDYYSGGWLIDNVSLGGSVTYSSSRTRTTGSGYSFHEEDGCKVTFKAETGTLLSNIGLILENETSAGYNHTYDESTSKSSASAISYTLAPNDYEFMTIDVYAAPDGFGPIFSTRGGQTYCPYEGEEKTKYFEPGQHEIHTATVDMEQPDLRVNVPSLTDVPIGGKAIYELTLANLADLDESFFTWLKLYAPADCNPNGAQIMLDGTALTDAGRLIKLYAGKPIKQTITLAQSDLGILEYDSVAIVMSSDCSSYRNGDTVWLSAKFVPTCSPIELRIDNRNVNTALGNELPIIITGYDRNFSNFLGFRLQCRRAGQNDWSLVREFTTKESEAKDGKKTYIDKASLIYTLVMTDDSYPDGEYEFRAVTMCAYGNDEINDESDIITVVKDMQRPVALGLPSPINGIYTNENQIYLDWNEPVQYGRIHDMNVSVQGVLNAHPVDHEVALQLVDEDLAYSTADFNFNGTDFTLEFWCYYDGNVRLFAHADGTGTGLTVRIVNGKMAVAKGAVPYVTSTASIPANQWCFMTIQYTAAETGGQLTAHYAVDAQEVVLFDHVNIPAYDMRGNILVGGYGTFKMHDLSLWNIDRDWRISLSERNKRKDSYTDGLLCYWPMDEGEGPVVRDAVRSRHLQLSSATQWWYNNDNIALTIPAGQVAKMPLAECPIPEKEDFTFECWFRMQQDGTLFYLSDSSLNVGFSGKNLRVTAKNGVWEVPALIPATDGTWHHIALNYRHNTLPAFILDDRMLDVTGIADMPAFASAYLIFSSENATADVDIDEVRLWNAYITPQNIALDRHSEMRGNENGLVAYYPMQKDTVDEAMQPVKVFSLEDRVTRHQLTLSPLTAHSSQPIAQTSPAIRRQRPLETVNHTYTASAQRLVINITESAARIEGCTLEMEVVDVTDEHGNYSAPIRWTTYVNRNQLLWQQDNIHVTKEALRDTTLVFTIENNSGQIENWSITNVPQWLTLSEDAGLLQPLQKKQITATISGALAIGNYEQTLFLVGNAAVQNPLRLTVRVNADQPEWSINSADYEYSMNIIATATIGNNVADDSNDLLAAFIGEQPVGVASPQLVSAYNRHYLMMDIYANLTQNEKDSINAGLTLHKYLTFKYWDASTGRIFTSIGITLPNSRNKDKDVLPFAGGQLIGSLDMPVQLAAGQNAEQAIDLDKGWNWFSFNVLPEDVSVNAVLRDMITDITIIKSQSEFAQVNSLRDSLQGSLKVLECIHGYKMHVSEPYTKTLEGSVINPLLFGIPVAGGQKWTWIGYLPQMSLDVNTALSNINPTKGDIVKARTGFAMWDGFQWIGSLKTMSPGNAYLYMNAGAEDMVLYYPSLVSAAAPARNVATQPAATQRSSAFAPVAPNQYQGNMTVTAVVMDGDQVVTDAEVAIYAGDECRAAAVQEDGYWFLTVPGDGNTELRIRVATGGEIKEVTQTLTYVDDAVVGSPDAPYIIQLDTETGLDAVPHSPSSTLPSPCRKFIKDGLMYIRRGDKTYNAQGAKVSN